VDRVPSSGLSVHNFVFRRALGSSPLRKLRAPGEAGAPSGAGKIQVAEAEPPQGAGAGAERAQQQPTWKAFGRLRQLRRSLQQQVAGAEPLAAAHSESWQQGQRRFLSRLAQKAESSGMRALGEAGGRAGSLRKLKAPGEQAGGRAGSLRKLRAQGEAGAGSRGKEGSAPTLPSAAARSES
jgi:hypothetical protein